MAVSFAVFVNCSKSAEPEIVNNLPDESKKINTAGWSDSPFISRDGKRLYFMYSRWDFSPWLRGGAPSSIVLAGPDRPRLNKSAINPFDESDIFMASKNADGTWGAIIDFGSLVNESGKIQDNPHISPDGNGLWFVSDCGGGLGMKDIWFSLKSTGSWGAPVNIGATFNSTGDEDQMWISPASNEIFWNTPSGLKTCVSNGGSCAAAPVSFSIPGCAYAAEVSMPDDGMTIYFGCGNLTTGRVSIMQSEKQPDGSWSAAKAVD